MKSTGIVRKLDVLGRIVVPIELRKTMELAEGDAVEIFTEGNSIILKKFETSCIFCGGKSNLVKFKEKYICQNCASKIK